MVFTFTGILTQLIFFILWYDFKTSQGKSYTSTIYVPNWIKTIICIGRRSHVGSWLHWLVMFNGWNIPKIIVIPLRTVDRNALQRIRSSIYLSNEEIITQVKAAVWTFSSIEGTYQEVSRTVNKAPTGSRDITREEEEDVLETLKKDYNVSIMKTEKRNLTVLLNKDGYRKRMYAIIDSYINTRLQKDLAENISRTVSKFIKKLLFPESSYHNQQIIKDPGQTTGIKHHILSVGWEMLPTEVRNTYREPVISNLLWKLPKSML